MYIRVIVGATNGPWPTENVCSHNKWPNMCCANRTENEKCKQSNMVGKSDRMAEWQVRKVSELADKSGRFIYALAHTCTAQVSSCMNIRVVVFFKKLPI